MKILKITFALLFSITIISSCETNFGEGPVDPVFIDPGRTPIGGGETPPPTPPTEDRYEIGVRTGKEDAEWLFSISFEKIGCWRKDKASGELVPDPDGKECTYRQTNPNFANDVLEYRALTQQKIDDGIDVEFNQGLLYGFNQKLQEYSLLYGIMVP